MAGFGALIRLSLSYAVRRPVAATLDALRTAVQIARLVRTAPILEPHPGLLTRPEALTPICSLVSDTHLTCDGGPPTELEHDGEQWPFSSLPTTSDLTGAVGKLLANILAHGSRTVIWCGDQVDTGSAAEWAEWKRLVDAAPGLSHHVVPGNHDVCFNRPFEEDVSLSRRALRERAFQSHGARLADYPIVDTIIGDAGPVTVLLLDSCKHRSEHVLSNAIGLYGDIQLAEVEKALATRSGPVLVVSHHHVWRDARFLSPSEWFTTTVDAAGLTERLLAYRARSARNQVLVVHGHRHVLTAGRISDGRTSIDVVGMPSSTLGDKSQGGSLDGIARYAMAGLQADGTWGVALVPVARLIATEASYDQELPHRHGRRARSGAPGTPWGEGLPRAARTE